MASDVVLSLTGSRLDTVTLLLFDEELMAACSLAPKGFTVDKHLSSEL